MWLLSGLASPSVMEIIIDPASWIIESITVYTHLGQGLAHMKRYIETGWGLRPGTLSFSAAVLELGQMSPPATKYKETIRN